MKPHLFNPNNKYLPQIVSNPEEVEFLVIDLFCGAGGTSTGFLNANGKALVIACINHDAKAIESHWLNHPEVLHFEEDIRIANLAPLIELLDRYRVLYPHAKVILWASLPCPHFSRALGGKPKDEDIRTMANSLHQKWDGEKHIDGDSYMQLLKPDYLMIENVVEFMSWGPLDKDMKPITKQNGRDWLKWSYNIRKLGYVDEWKQLNSADFAAYTSRNRLFGCFAKEGLPIAWPFSTHAKNPIDGGMFGKQKKWKAVKHVLDLEDEGSSIFNRKKELSDKTLEVIAKGFSKELKSKDSFFLLKYYGNTSNLNSIDEPAGTITTKDRFALIFRQYKTGYTSSIDEPIGVLPTNPKANLVSFIMNPSHGGHTTSIEKPCPVIIARQDKAPLYIIKCLMAENGISDIKMRMLKVSELKQIQGFPVDYILIGNQTDQKKFIGNSVVPQVVTAWCLAMANKLEDYRRAA